MIDSGDPERKPAEEESPMAAGATPPTSGLECPTCGDRFPSQEALEEHMPTHKP